MPDEGIEFVEFGHRDGAIRLWWLLRQGVGVRSDPVGHRLVDHAEVPGDAAQVHPIGIQLQGLAARGGVVARGCRLGRVRAPARLTQVALAAGRVAPVLDLARRALAGRTG